MARNHFTTQEKLHISRGHLPGFALAVTNNISQLLLEMSSYFMPLAVYLNSIFCAKNMHPRKNPEKPMMCNIYSGLNRLGYQTPSSQMFYRLPARICIRILSTVA